MGRAFPLQPSVGAFADQLSRATPGHAAAGRAPALLQQLQRAAATTPGGLPARGAALVNGSVAAEESFALADSGGLWSPKHGQYLELIHVPKTGGTSIEDWGVDHGFAWGRNRDWASLLPPYGVAGAPVFSGGRNQTIVGAISSRWAPAHCQPWHTPRRQYVSQGGFDPYAAKRTVCAVRHPLTRAVSDYIYQQAMTFGPPTPENPGGEITLSHSRAAVACHPELLNSYVQDSCRT
eukprot:4544995-Prymnesium_polylepis.1